jgi:antitoxin CptB
MRRTWTVGTSLCPVSSGASTAFFRESQDGAIGADIRILNRYIRRARLVRAFGVALDFGMTGSTRSSGGLDERRKRLLFRCWHRGTREMDLILGRFADAEIARLSDGELSDFERLIEVSDPDLYAALTSDEELAPADSNALFDRIKAFRASGSDR